MLPWLRIGLSWAVLLPWLFRFGSRSTLELFLSRNLLALFCGGQASTTFLISGLSGGASILLAGPWVRLLVARRLLGWVGAGAILACVFNYAQLGVASGIVVGHAGLLSQAGPLLLWSVISGAGVAAVSFRLWRNRDWEELSQDLPPTPPLRAERGLPIRLVAALAAIAATFLSGDLLAVGVFAALSLLLGGLELRAVAGGWPFFAWMAWFHLRSPGHYLSGIPVTSEGVDAFLLHGMRLVALLAAGPELGRNLPWHRLAGRRTVWAQGLLLALPLTGHLFPAAVDAARGWRPGRAWEPRFWAALERRVAIRETDPRCAAENLRS